MRRVACAPAPHTLVAGCSDPAGTSESGSSGTCAQHTGAATRRQQHAGGRKRQTTLRRRAHYRGPRPAGTGMPVRTACSSPAMSHHRLRGGRRRPASTIDYNTWRPKAPGRRPNHCFTACRGSFEQMHLRAPQRSEGPKPGTFGRDGAKGKRGVRSWARAGRRRVGPGPSAVRRPCRALRAGDIARPSMVNRHAAIQAAQTRRPLHSAAVPRPTASASSALTDMKLGACIASGLRRHLRAARRPHPRRRPNARRAA